jgi:hypothetical protein
MKKKWMIRNDGIKHFVFDSEDARIIPIFFGTYDECCMMREILKMKKLPEGWTINYQNIILDEE